MARAKYKQLDRDRRLQMEALFRAGLKPRAIAEQIGCHISTVYREFRRGEYEHLNSDYTTERRYSADKAEALHQLNATAKGAPLKIGKNFAVAEFIEGKIKDDKYSPAAVCALLRTEEYAHFGITFCRANPLIETTKLPRGLCSFPPVFRRFPYKAAGVFDRRKKAPGKPGASLRSLRGRLTPAR